MGVPCILVVERHDDTREATVPLLETAGYEVDTAADCAAARQRLTAQAYGLLLLDWQAAGNVDGFFVWLAAQREQTGSPAGVVVMTADGRALRDTPPPSWADALLQPFEADKVLELAEKYCGPPPSSEPN